MEVYILDSLYRRTAVVDKFESLVWTERFSGMGDFQLDIASSTQTKKLFLPGTRLSIPNSLRVMTVETAEDATDDDGREILKITGYSLEKNLEHRLVMYIDEIDGHWVNWYVFGTPKAKVLQMFDDICVLGVLNAGDVMAGVTVGSDLFPDDTISAPTESLDYSLDPKTLYEATKELCDAYSMGFRFVRDPNTSAIYYDVYTGCDRTTSQTTFPAVVFSPGMGNLKNTREVNTSAFYKNVAYVVYGNLHEIVYATDIDPSIEGFERKVLFVKVDNLDVVDVSAEMIQIGKNELAKHRNLTALDGEVAGASSYQYGIDYNLGDLVELRDAEGTSSQMRVTEQIIISDKEGDRSYPTLTIETYVTPGSWLALSPVVEWLDYDAETWSVLP